MAKRLILNGLITLLIALPIIGAANDLLSALPELRGAGVLLLDHAGKPSLSKHATTPLIPASTTKLVTAWLALNHWGEDHRFQTPFYYDPDSHFLWIKASGDPFLVSEEILRIAKNLRNLGIYEVAGFGIDSSLFQAELHPPGNGSSTNPYDAISTPLAANFNTIFVENQHDGIISAEKQTPITGFSRFRGQAISGSRERINTGPHAREAERYFAELLMAFLRQNGVLVRNKVFWGKAPEKSPIYIHKNSKTLADIILPMMQYSTNFIANQLVLILSAEQADHPVNFIDVQDYMEDTLTDRFGWQNITLKDGAGLSRDNRLSAQQLVELLDAFRPWRHLLPEIANGIYAKSGTLNKVSTLAGYIVDTKQRWQPFALMMPRSVAHQRRNQLVQRLIK